jgi:hypothetical protein
LACLAAAGKGGFMAPQGQVTDVPLLGRYPDEPGHDGHARAAKRVRRA